MSIRNLEQEVKRRVIEAVKGIQLTNDKGEYVDPLVETGALPKEAVKGNPYILIQTTSVSDGDQESSAEVTLLYGTVGISKSDSKDEGQMNHVQAFGHWDVIAVIDKLRSNFLKDVNFIFGYLNRDIKHEVFGEVSFPFYLGETKLKFVVPTVLPQNGYL